MPKSKSRSNRPTSSAGSTQFVQSKQPQNAPATAEVSAKKSGERWYKPWKRLAKRNVASAQTTASVDLTKSQSEARHRSPSTDGTSAGADSWSAATITSSVTPTPRKRRAGTKMRQEKIIVILVALVLVALLGVVLYMGVWIGTIGWLVLVWFVYVWYYQSKFDRTIGRPVPTMGWRKAVMQMLGWLQITYVPKRGVRELEHLEAQRHRDLRARGFFEVASFGPCGRSGKGTAASNQAALSAETSDQPTLLSDTRPKLGNIPVRFFLWRRKKNSSLHLVAPGRCFTIRQAITALRVGLFETAAGTFQLLGSVVGMHLAVIGSDVSEVDTPREELPIDGVNALFDRLGLYYTAIFHEPDNELGHASDVALMDRVTIPQFMAVEGEELTIVESVDAIRHYRGRSRSFAQKIDRYGVVVIHAARGKTSKAEYASQFGVRPEQVFLVPYDKYFKPKNIKQFLDQGDPAEVRYAGNAASRRRIGPPPVTTSRMKRRSRLAYLEFMNFGMAAWVADHNISKDPRVISTPEDNVFGAIIETNLTRETLAASAASTRYGDAT